MRNRWQSRSLRGLTKKRAPSCLRLWYVLTTALRCIAAVIISVTPSLFAAESDGAFQKSIRPLLSEYCLKCHSTEKHKGDMDLERFSSLAEIKKHPKVWQTV